MKTKLLHRIRCHTAGILNDHLYSIKLKGGFIHGLSFSASYDWAFEHEIIGTEANDFEEAESKIFSVVEKRVWEREKPKYMKNRRKNNVVRDSK